MAFASLQQGDPSIAGWPDEDAILRCQPHWQRAKRLLKPPLRKRCACAKTCSQSQYSIYISKRPAHGSKRSKSLTEINNYGRYPGHSTSCLSPEPASCPCMERAVSYRFGNSEGSATSRALTRRCVAKHTLSLPLKMITALAESAASAATLSYTAGLTRVSACTFTAPAPQTTLPACAHHADCHGHRSTALWLGAFRLKHPKTINIVQPS